MKNKEITQVELTLNGHDYFDSLFIIKHLKKEIIDCRWPERDELESKEPYNLLNYMEHIACHMCAFDGYERPKGQSTVKIDSRQLEDYKRASMWLKSLKKVKIELNLPEIK